MSKKIIFIIIIITVIIITSGGGLVYWYFLRRPSDHQANANAKYTITNYSGNVINNNANQLNVNDAGDLTENKEAELKRVAMSFAERFGSYSNQSNFENIEHLKIYMTDSMAAWADRYVEETKVKNADTSVYYGITTESLKVETILFDEAGGKAEFMVTTQRKESQGTTSDLNIFYQDIKIDMIMAEGGWLVNGAWWQ
jgi:hypothetical protein